MINVVSGGDSRRASLANRPAGSASNWIAVSGLGAKHDPR